LPFDEIADLQICLITGNQALKYGHLVSNGIEFRFLYCLFKGLLISEDAFRPETMVTVIYHNFCCLNEYEKYIFDHDPWIRHVKSLGGSSLGICTNILALPRNTCIFFLIATVRFILVSFDLF